MTVTDFRAPGDERNALVATAIDVRGFWDRVIGCVRERGRAMNASPRPGAGR